MDDDIIHSQQNCSDDDDIKNTNNNTDLYYPLYTDTISAFRDVFVKDTFDSFEEFDFYFQKYQNQTGSVFRVKSSSSVISENKRRQQQIPVELKYSSVSFVCVHYGIPKPKGFGIRQKQHYLPSGCNVMISLTVRKKKLIISKTYLHHNHEVNVALQSFYSQKRRLTSSEMKEAGDMVLRHNPDNKQLKSFLEAKYHKNLTMQDVRNIKRKVKKNRLQIKQESGIGVEESRNEKLLKAMLYQMNPQNPQNITVPAALGKPMTLENRKVPLSTSSTSNSTLTPETIQIEDVPPPTKKPKEIQIEIDEDESNDASKSDLQSTLEPPTQKIITASSSSTSSSVPSAKSKPAQSVSVVNALDVNRPQKQKRILVVPNHQQSVMSNLSSLWKAGRLCDAFISNGTVNVKVHKMILGAVCPKVLDVFYNTPQHKLPKVTFPSSVSKEALLAFAEYMYNGVLDLDFDLLNQMKVIAHRLDMKDFEQLCNNQINSSLVPNMMPTILEPMLSEPCSSSGLIQGLQTTVMERVQTSNRAHTKNGLHAVSSLSTVPSAASNSGISLSSLPLVEVRAETDDNLMEVNNELGGSGGAEDSRSSRVKIEKVDLDDQAYGGEAVSSEMNFSTSDSLTANNFAMPHFPNSDLSHSSSTSSQHTNNTFNKPVSVTHVWSKKNKERANVELGSLDPYPTGLYTIDWSNLPPSTQEIKQEYSID